MSNQSPDTQSGSRTTRLGLIGLGFVIGVIVTLLILFAINIG